MEEPNNLTLESLAQAIDELNEKYKDVDKDIKAIITKIDFLEKLFFMNWQSS
jgi:hypothetical protein